MPSETEGQSSSVDIQDAGSFDVQVEGSTQVESISTEQKHQQEEGAYQPCVENEQPGETGCTQCVKMKAKVVALQKKCYRLRGKLSADTKGKLDESEVSHSHGGSQDNLPSDSQHEDNSSETFESETEESFHTNESVTSSQSLAEDSDDNDSEEIRYLK